MKRTCNGCRAFEEVRQHYTSCGKGSCQLGFQVKDIYSKIGSFVESKPLEICPKPKTLSQFMEAVKNNSTH